jgi:asparagine synthase (glutamine-hydrolysing)
VFRYLALVWNDAQPQANVTAAALGEKLAASGWHCAVSREGLRVFHVGARAGSSGVHALADHSGAVMGRLFSGSAAAPALLGEGESAAIVATGGRHLVENYWGRYVAFVHDAASGATQVLRDPSAGMPCLNTGFEGVELFFPLLEDVLALGVTPFNLHWPYLAGHLCFQIMEIRASALKEVSRVLPGECVQVHQGVKSYAFYWNPLEISRTGVIEDPTEAAAALRRVVRECVHAWASGHSHILHTLSGGLDSSIVMACLNEAPGERDITCVNYYSPGSNSDERGFAQLVARQAGRELIERERDLSIRFETLLQAPRSAYPVNCRYYLENSEWEARLARERQASAIFCGEGGDQIFYQSRARFAAGDYLCRKGLLRGVGSGLFRVALDCARLDRISMSAVLRDAFAQAIAGRRWNIRDDLGLFKQLIPSATTATVKGDGQLAHPLFSHPDRTTPSGKLWHAYQLAFPAMDFHDPLGCIQDAERIAPLSSQPVLELCLRIPADVLTAGGWDRAIARRAFRHELPRDIVLRRVKGGLDEYQKNVLLRNMPFTRELLLDGRLVRENLIDRVRLEQALSDSPSRIGADTMELFDCVNLEAWVRRCGMM